MLILRSIVIFALLVSCMAWNSADLQMFDLVDELKMSFYDFLGVEQTASTEDIRKAYRKLSLQLHPDRNADDPNAPEKFRQLVGVYEILKDSELRERYNDVLQNGLPGWREAVFYYRKLRKMSNIELFTLFAVLSTTIHYAVLWGSRYEKRWIMEEQLNNFYKLHKAKDKKREAIELEIMEHLKEIPTPKWHDLLPFALCKGVYYFIMCLPVLLSYLKTQVYIQIDRFQKERQRKRELMEERALKERLKIEKHERKRRQLEQKQNEPTAYDDDMWDDLLSLRNIPVSMQTDASVQKNTEERKEWSVDDLGHLVRAVARFPGGVSDRWTRIAQELERPVPEVIAKAKELGEIKANRFRLDAQMSNDVPAFEVNENAVCGDSSEESDDSDKVTRIIDDKTQSSVKEVNNSEIPTTNPSIENDSTQTVSDEPYMSRKKQKQQQKELMATRKIPEPKSLIESTDGWSQVEQNQLEVAIRSIDKTTPERWDRIADCVPTKTKAEVMQRVKHLSSLTKTRLHRP